MESKKLGCAFSVSVLYVDDYSGPQVLKTHQARQSGFPVSIFPRLTTTVKTLPRKETC